MRLDEDIDTMKDLLRSEDAKLRLQICEPGQAYIRIGSMDGALFIHAAQPLKLPELDYFGVREYMKRRNRLVSFTKKGTDKDMTYNVKNSSVETNTVSSETDRINMIVNDIVDTILNYVFLYKDLNIANCLNIDKIIDNVYFTFDIYKNIQ